MGQARKQDLCPNSHIPVAKGPSSPVDSGSACPGIRAQPTEVEQGLPFFLSCPVYTSRPQSPQVVTQTQPCTWLRLPHQPSELSSGRIVAAVIRIVHRCSAATNKTKTWILNSPGAWMPFAPGFRAGAASSIQGVKDAEDGHSTWRCGQTTGKGRRCWLRVGTTAQPGARGASTACTMGWEGSKPPAVIFVLTFI